MAASSQSNNKPERMPCRYFSNGSCRFGNKCKQVHPHSSATLESLSKQIEECNSKLMEMAITQAVMQQEINQLLSIILSSTTPSMYPINPIFNSGNFSGDRGERSRSVPRSVRSRGSTSNIRRPRSRQNWNLEVESTQKVTNKSNLKNHQYVNTNSSREKVPTQNFSGSYKSGVKRNPGKEMNFNQASQIPKEVSKTVSHIPQKKKTIKRQEKADELITESVHSINTRFNSYHQRLIAGFSSDR